MTRALHWLPGLLCCLSLVGCCAISQGMVALFCGPSTDPWVKVSYRTPKEALETFQAAVAREDADVISQSLSPDFKRSRGLGRMEVGVVLAWLKKEFPGFHTLGLAKIVATPTQQPTVVEHILEVAFHRFRVRLKRYTFKRVVVAVPGLDEPIPKGDYLPDFSRNLRIIPREETSTVEVRDLEVDVPDLLAENILEVTLGRTWKVDLLKPVTDKE